MIQCIKCKCGKIFAACLEPHCYTDSDWTKELAKYVKKGCTVEMKERGNWTMESCDCDKKEVNNNQLSLQL